MRAVKTDSDISIHCMNCNNSAHILWILWCLFVSFGVGHYLFMVSCMDKNPKQDCEHYFTLLLLCSMEESHAGLKRHEGKNNYIMFHLGKVFHLKGLKIIILCIWCNRICWYDFMFKKHIIFQILYIIVGPLCPASLKRFVFYKVPPSDKHSLLWLANWPSALWLAEHHKHESEI